MLNMRSLLFVPGSRPDRFDKALAAGADVVCIDLEDAVSPDAREVARKSLQHWLAGCADPAAVCVRINPPESPAGVHDLAALAAGAVSPGLLMVPKCEQPAALRAVAEHLPGTRLIALVESPLGVLNAAAIAGACEQVVALMFGAADFSATAGCEMAWESLLYARSHLVLAAAAAGCQVIDVPFMDIADHEGLRAETQRVQHLGYTGKAAIHPAQVAVIHAAQRPPPEAVAWARRVLDAVAGDETRTAVVDGAFVDRPLVLRARRILARAQRG
jgi:citrate lyase beta subunit